MTYKKNSIASQYTSLPSARIEALKALAGKVEAGTLDGKPESRDLAESAFGSEWVNVGLAYAQGSLDAAKALHEAVLPDFILGTLAQRGETWVAVVTAWREDHPTQKRIYGTSNADNPARAWLLAILKAHISEMEA